MRSIRERRRKEVSQQHDPGSPTVFVQMFPSSPSGVNKRISHEDRAALIVAELAKSPGGRQIVKLAANGHITITEYDSVSVRSRLVATAARAALGAEKTTIKE